MSRPTKDESIYKVSIHKNGGYVYAATHPYTVDENGNRRYVYCHWGGVYENKKKFTCNIRQTLEIICGSLKKLKTQGRVLLQPD